MDLDMDMAEMVPVEFWSFMNSSVKMKNPEAFLLAEVYQPKLFRDYIHKGKMDYLYDKVDLYDTLKACDARIWIYRSYCAYSKSS